MKLDQIPLALLAERYKGLAKAADLTESGLSYKQIRLLVAAGVLEKIGRGMYRFPDHSYDERLEIARRIPIAVFCLYSACYLHELSDFVPSEQHIAVPKKSRFVLPDYPPVKLYYWEATAFETGITSLLLDEMPIRVYDPEKTVCDMFRLRSKTGMDMVKEVLTNYLNRPDRNLAQLHEYARQLRIEKQLTPILSLLI